MYINKNQPIVVGQRQILRELKRDNVELIQIARDADKAYIETITAEAKKHGVTVTFDGTMNALAKRFHIDCATGAIAVVKVGEN